jgi:hypothetical protein
MVNQLKKCKLFIHTGALESYHNLILEYASKETYFSYTGMLLRTILAILDHNSNLGRHVVGTKIVFSPSRKEFVEKNVYEEKSDAWRHEIARDILLFATEQPNLVVFSPDIEEELYPFHIPDTIHGLTKPNKRSPREQKSRRRVRARSM